ncbi:MAG: secretin N-terminal domain-containing protein, partial [Planctomyces sp.]
SGVDAGEVTKSLDSMMPGVVINEDSRAGRIHIWGTERQHQQVEEWIRQFDGRGGSGSVAVIPLVRMDPLTASATLRSLFLSEGNSAPTIESDLTGRRLIVKGSADQIAQIRTVLTGLGEDGTGVRQNSQSGPVRRFSLQGRNPDEFLRYLQQSWESTERTPIRVIIPGNQGPIRDRRTPGKPETNPQRSESLPEESKDRHRDSTSQNRLRDRVLMTSSQTEPADSNETETTDAASNGAESNGEQPSQSEPEATEPESTDGIRVLVHGDELILSSSDEAALDRMESLLESLHQSLPQRSTWTVFYLQAADATETATMLEQIFPASSVTKTAAEGGLSFSSMFRPVTDTVSNMTGLSSLSTSPQVLRIIPDIRSNSLFVTGPEMLIRDVEEVLKVLDASDLPESLREMQPRMIEVRYADINEVSQIVNEVFKPYLEAPAAARQQANPFAALMGGGNRGNSESAQVRMTIGVDTQTSTLIVSSSEALFTQVQELVGNLDESSRSANRQVKVVQLKNADVADVQESLTSLFPRVRTNVSQSTTGGSSEGGNSRGQASERERSGNNNQDPFQQMLQERFRQRAAEMGGGGRNGGGGLPGDFGGRGGFNNGNRGSQNGAGNQGRGQQGRRGNR